jgi:hypothetical protein
MKLIGSFVGAACAVLLVGCASTGDNPFRKYYQTALTSELRKKLEPSFERPESPVIIETSNMQLEMEKLLERNYAPLGVSDFHGSMVVTREQLIEFATRLGADRVLFHREHQFDENGVRRVVRYDPESKTTTTTDGRIAGITQGNAFGSVTTSSASSDTFTSEQTSTTSRAIVQEIPYTIKHFGYVASYWRHRKPPIFGALCEDLPKELREQLQRNTGAVVRYIIIDSPAFRANLFQGDLIVALNGLAVVSQNDFNNLVEQLADKLVRVEYLRKGQPMLAEIQFNPALARSSTSLANSER